MLRKVFKKMFSLYFILVDSYYCNRHDYLKPGITFINTSNHFCWHGYSLLKVYVKCLTTFVSYK